MRSTYRHMPWWLTAVLVFAAFAILGAVERANAAPAASHTTTVTQIFVKQAEVLETKSGKPHIGVGHAAAGSIGGCDTSGSYKCLYFKKEFSAGGTGNTQAV